MRSTRTNVRNVVIIAHADHGKTTLVDQLLRQGGMLRANQEVVDRVMGSNNAERGRGITIPSKNTAVNYDGAKINVIDTPRHADLGGEVERILKMVNGAVLVVDVFEGTMPQTRSVLEKTLELSPDAVVRVDKCGCPEACSDEVVDEVLELLMDFDTTDQQLEYPFIFALARGGQVRISTDSDSADMKPLFGAIINHIPAPEGDPEAPTQILTSTIDCNEYVDRIGVGKVDNGSIRVNQEVAIVNHHKPDKPRRVEIGKLYEYEGLNRVEAKEAEFGPIVAVPGVSDLHIDDTITSPEPSESIPLRKVSEPTISINFMVNDSPLVGQEGQYITSHHLHDCLLRELNTDASLRVEELTPDCLKVSGHGEPHFSVLIENMRREGFEFAVSKVEAIYHYNERDKRQEPMEIALVDVPDEFTGAVIQKLTSREGELIGMTPIHGNFMCPEFNIPSRGLIGHRGESLIDAKGNGVLNIELEDYGPYKGDIFYRKTGSIIAYESGEAAAYGFSQAQERGQFFIGAGVKIYASTVIGQSGKSEDVEVNICKTKKPINTRASSPDDVLKLVTPKVMGFEQYLESIDTDEFLEVTSENLRIRKRILDPTLRKRAMIRQRQNS